MVKPSISSSKCGYCHKTVNDDCEAIQCEGECNLCFHIHCVEIDRREYNRLSNCDEEWTCDKCALIKSNSMLKGEIQNLNVALLALRDDIKDLQNLYEEERRKNVSLSEICLIKEEEIVKLNSKVSNTVDQQTIRPWQIVSRSKQPNLNLSLPVRPSTGDLTDFPPLPLKNRFTPLENDLDNTSEVNFPLLEHKYSALQQDGDRSCSESQVAQSDLLVGLPEQSSTLDTKKFNPVSLSKPKSLRNKTNSKIKCTPVNVHIFGDSQGRGVSTELAGISNHRVSSMIYPGAKFEDVTSSSTNTKLNSDDFVVFFGGTNDVSRNEGKMLLTSLNRRLREHQGSNIVVLSVPHRYDLPPWSCVNTLIRDINNSMRKRCSLFDNCKFIDISSLGRRFHTNHGLHLNHLGKKLIASLISKAVHDYFTRCEAKYPVIPVGFLGQTVA